jgi:CRISPR/Cas system-associated exonuclease Cas4 (RecB family)
MIKGIRLKNGKTIKLDEFNEVYDIPSPILDVIKPFNKKTIDDFCSYGIYEINNCLRYSYYDRIEGHYESIKQLFSSAFGRAVHKTFLERFDVSEKTVKLEFLINGEKIILVAKPDGYDFSKKTLIDVKTVKDAESNKLPRRKDILQLQYFWSVINVALPAMHIDKLQLFYCDRQGGYKNVDIDKVNWINEIKKRLNILHDSLKTRVPPEEEISDACNYCPFRNKCNLETLIIQNLMVNRKRLYK